MAALLLDLVRLVSLNSLSTSRQPTFDTKHRSAFYTTRSNASAHPYSTTSTMQHPTSEQGLNLLDLPIELLDLIILYCVNTEPMTVNLAPNAGSLTRTLFTFIPRRRRYTVSGYPRNLLLINRLIYRLAFDNIWTHKSLVISLTPSDTLCFLLHALSQQQKDALCKIQLPRFLLSWSFPVNSDIWLVADKEKGESWYEGAKVPEKEVKGKRFQALVGILCKRYACLCRLWKLNIGLIQA
ncbi:hypothetical protein M436DRAFT_40295 [Aureobasidium namibiae CBS 147.97]|uniref:F-box domain-containing protein n=1 Tax=Aureobasidium namibiae CBS 147.97 TaxID=1043004 RepID=A0A074WSJ1_9PEZI|nr:uncharacterized protein M436DRAFT_40295 [Aureobasidium namibiae CBS 147.97]KEQ76115.1 hypothetical protein M436DRAFT_40295 [Aureobasidium namibiae CBS 147.97]